MNLLELRGVSRTYGSSVAVDALSGVSVSVAAGEVLAIVGPSGSGKSTLLRIMGLLDVPSSGEVRLDGRPVHDAPSRVRAEIRRSAIGFVFQDFALLPHLAALDNVQIPLLYRGMSLRERVSRAHDRLVRLGLEERAAHHPAELSGGEQQRVALARATVHAPALLLADEPTGNLDTVSGGVVLEELRRIATTGTAVVIVAHDDRVVAASDRVVAILDGRLVAGER